MEVLAIKIISNLYYLVNIEFIDIVKSFKNICELALQNYILTRQNYCNGKQVYIKATLLGRKDALPNTHSVKKCKILCVK
jgi:hypothetical protein